MELNKLIFPAPNSSYTPFTLERIMWVPRSRFFSLKTLSNKLDTYENTYFEAKTFENPENIQKIKHIQIPCLFQEYAEGSAHYILFFHGNAEDIGYSADFTKRLSTGLKAHVIAVEYPGYGVYEGETCANTIIEDAEIVFDFLTHEAGICSENIFVFGRSIGSGPATHLAANRSPGILMLMSPYTSIKDAVKDIAGELASYLVADRFRNIDEIQKVKCPTFFVHGKKDKLIPDEHCKQLFTKCKAIAAMNLSEHMTHNEFSLSNDIIRPIKKFMKQIGMNYEACKEIPIPNFVFKIPLKSYRKKKSSALEEIQNFAENLINNKVYSNN